MLAVTLAALPAAALVIGAALRSPLRHLVVASPGDDRWHVVETPLLGGFGIFAGLLAGIGGAVAAGAVDATGELAGVLGACALLFLLGLADDIRGLRPATKLVGQLAAVTIVLASGLKVEAVNNELLATAVAVLWLVGMTNAINFLDNMDGLAATLAAVACGLFAIDAVSAHPSRLVLVLAVAVGCACLGFLPFNLRRRSQVFMGDSGSQVLGFALGSLALLSTWKAAAPSLAAVLLPVLVLAIPILDTTLVTILRLREGRPVYAGGRDHTSHRLVYGGLSEKRAVVLLASLAAAVGGTGLAYSAVDSLQVTLIGVLVTFALLAQFAGALAGVGALGTTFARWTRPNWARALEVLGDSALIACAFACAYLLRYGGLGTGGQRELFANALPVLLASRLACFILFGLYAPTVPARRRFVRIVGAVALSEGIAVGLLAMSDENAFAIFSRSVFLIDALICAVVVVAARLARDALARPLPQPAGRAVPVAARDVVGPR